MATRSIMPGLSLVEEFAAAAEAVADAPALNRLTGDAARALGFDFFGIVHHITFGTAGAGHVSLHCYPEAWVAALRDAGRPSDPVLRAAERRAAGFRWDRMDRIIALDAAERRYMERAAAQGIGAGYTVPNHVPGEAPGSASFAVRAGRALPERNLAAAQALGGFAFEAARRLTRDGAGRWFPPVPLSERQRDCVRLVARGRSDVAIAARLGLKRGTVNEHVEAAKRRYGVGTRAQLVVQALMRGEIAFAEILEPAP